MEADLTKHGLPTLVGIIDLVRPGGRIVDFKTSGKTPDPETVGHLNDTQMAAYGVLYREGTGKKESGLELHHPGQNQESQARRHAPPADG